MEEQVQGVLEELTRLAAEWKVVKDKITVANANLEDLKSEKERLSNQMTQIVQGMGDAASEGVRLAGVGTVELDVRPFPKVTDVDEFISWAKENQIEAPRLSINDKTLASWFKAQVEAGLPVPPDEILKPFWKTTAKVVKS